MIKSEICELLGIRYPIFQGGMAWIADGKLAAVVSEGGGLGIIAAGNAPGDYVREQIQIARSLTKHPIGVNIMLLSPFADEVAQVVIEEKVNVVTTGAGNPSKYIRDWKEAGIHVIPVVASVALAKLMTRLGASALIAEGGESGGHVGELTTMVLVPQICDATRLRLLLRWHCRWKGICGGIDAGCVRRTDGNALFKCRGMQYPLLIQRENHQGDRPLHDGNGKTSGTSGTQSPYTVCKGLFESGIRRYAG